MASDAAPSATDSPSLVTPAHATAAPPSASASTPVGSPKQPVARADPAPPSNKRPREDSPAVPTSPSFATHFQRDYSPTKIARLGLTAQLSPPFQLTGAAAIAEERRRKEEEQRRNPPGVSENPHHKALSELMSGATMTVSRPQDAPPAMDEIALAAEATKALGPVTIPQPNVSDARTDISPPHSASSAGGAADSHALMNSPGPMDVDQRSDRQSYASQPEAQMDEKTATSLSYPGILSPNAATQAPAPPPRPSSLPHGADHTPTSSKKHKCPYCDTEFTRHHNLKSHLLTHSQEKPYLCKDCGLRFRRLHDLKRHGKLHTGEKNHECPKCGRKFARGDALARHSKGAGGCAGRRASMGSYGEQGDFDGMPRNEGDESMVGISYDENGDVDMADDERRRQSLPAAVKGHHATGSEGLVPNSHTYPPAGGAARGGAPSILYPPNNSSAAVPAGIVNSISGITESPKPLSPAMQDQTRQRSPGLAAQFQHPQQQQQQQQYGRRQSDRDTHPLPALPPPHSTINPLVHVIRLHQPTNGPQGQQTSPPGLAPNNTNTNNNSSSSTTSHSRTAAHANSGDNTSANLFAQADQGMWAYMQQLEDKVKEMSERLLSFESLSNAREARLVSVESTLAQRDAKITSMEAEIAGLRKELVEKP